MQLYEILVPVTNAGKKIPKCIHREWDHKVSEIAGGLTLFKAKKGRWLHQGVLFREKMILVRIAATQEQMEQIVALTKKFYTQEAIMYYTISNEVRIV